ncbi:MAG TPA: UDP-N-acetylmuramoyl-tripeptide--D-alanyl-D-alanine ligase [Solirubrobacteraceae bacterium]|jgi:UDP-N-acetylmuramoyl-tripeptide--D-alanyl-D-alanine ligase|nr:UDP-N-acetylmuramoyl-tripeptide--D-alanyl-D-alanine ligase [Solirubrobacteraceae bacterium]
MSAFQGTALALALLALAVRLGGRQHRLLHLLQLEHYENARLRVWLRRRGERFQPRELTALATLYASALASQGAGAGWLSGAFLALTLPLGWLGVADWRREAVKPLVLTGRAKRLLALALLAPALLVCLGIAIAIAGVSTGSLALALTLALLALAGAPETLIGANLALAPVQRSINERYVTRARRTLAQVAPSVIGITGSYGKTTTKFCTGAVLEQDRPTLVTPESYNSLLGVVRTINEQLRPEHESFVVEMGMFRRGDVAELCELVHPSIGVITAIGPMHLERLGSIEAIAQAKGELLDALPPQGLFVTNAQDPHCLALARRAHVPVTLFAIADGERPTTSGNGRAPQAPPSQTDTPQAQVIARDVRLADGRTRFELLLDGPDSEPLAISAGLLGRHNVANLLAAAAVGRALGIAPEPIAAGLAAVRAPAHRLQPIHNRAAGVVVIDDAYNSNPDGARAALEVLREHPATRRLLVTPGMVELGELEAPLNRAFGEQAAFCDLAILVGPERTAPIREGLADGGMDATGVHVVRDIGEATALLAKLTRSGDVVLFENDLPDTYAA